MVFLNAPELKSDDDAVPVQESLQFGRSTPQQGWNFCWRVWFKKNQISGEYILNNYAGYLLIRLFLVTAW